MILNYQNLMVVSKFALLARNHIGIVKVAKMCSNEQYACKILVKAILAENKELVVFTRSLSQEFDVGIILINSIEIYIGKIKYKNFNEKFIQATKLFIPELTDNLYGIEVRGATYREAVEKFLTNVEVKDRTFCVNLAREFYLIWRSANKLTSQIEKEQALKLNEKNVEFMQLWKNIDLEVLTDKENSAISLYTNSMLQKGLNEKDIIISLRISKFILIELRIDYRTTNLSFRNAIDRTFEFFENLELKTFFLNVSREFYKFWVVNEQLLENESDNSIFSTVIYPKKVRMALS